MVRVVTITIVLPQTNGLSVFLITIDPPLSVLSLFFPGRAVEKTRCPHSGSFLARCGACATIARSRVPRDNEGDGAVRYVSCVSHIWRLARMLVIRTAYLYQGLGTGRLAVRGLLFSSFSE
jgi:hypothetical protein